MKKLGKRNLSYYLGFVMSDGHIRGGSRNRGAISIEINSRDKDILEKLHSILPVKSSLSKRDRYTTFPHYTKVYHSSYTCLKVFDLSFRMMIISCGIPTGKKSDIITVPIIPFSRKDFWRGMIDGDGSMGITAKNIPYISLVVSSDDIRNEYLKLIKKITGKELNPRRNKRDSIYNILLTVEAAQKLVRYLYPPNCLAMNRKIEKAKEVMAWVRDEKTKR